MSLVESKERMTMNKQFSQRFLDLALNNKYGVIPSRADLPAWWKLIPPEIPFPRNPKLPARIAFLKTYIGQSDTKRWAGEGLLRLLREYVDNEEDSFTNMPMPNVPPSWARRKKQTGIYATVPFSSCCSNVGILVKRPSILSQTRRTPRRRKPSGP